MDNLENELDDYLEEMALRVEAVYKAVGFKGGIIEAIDAGVNCLLVQHIVDGQKMTEN